MEENGRNLSAFVVRNLVPDPRKKYYVWNARVPNLCVIVYPSGTKTFYYVYSFRGRARFYRLGPARLDINEVRKQAKVLDALVAQNRDPQAERREHAAADTFGQLHARYVIEYAQLHNKKSWQQPLHLGVEGHRLEAARCTVSSRSKPGMAYVQFANSPYHRSRRKK